MLTDLIFPLSSGGGYTQKELESFRPIIYNNLVSQMKILIEASSILNCPIAEEHLVRTLNRPVGEHLWSLAVASPETTFVLVLSSDARSRFWRHNF